MTTDKVLINRAPVLTLWAAIVAERLGYDHDAALTLGRAVAGLNAQSKGRSLGIFNPSEGEGKGEGDEARSQPERVPLLGREVEVVRTANGLRAASKGEPQQPASVERYLQSKFKGDLPAVTEALNALAASLTPERLAEEAYTLYERFRPAIPSGTAGWGKAGELDLGLIRKLADMRRTG
ncbi:MAG: hypothetical protein ACYCYF_02780 [Anaerolineae bacterium]